MTTTPATTPPSDVALPAGAVTAGEWQHGYRVFEGEQREIRQAHHEEPIAVWTFGHQRADGSIRAKPEYQSVSPAISVSGIHWEEPITAETARRLADLLLTAADEIDGWATT